LKRCESGGLVVQLDGVTYRLSPPPGTTDEDSLAAVRSYLDPRDSACAEVMRVDLEGRSIER
jgi:hypothetical protein